MLISVLFVCDKVMYIYYEFIYIIMSLFLHFFVRVYLKKIRLSTSSSSQKAHAISCIGLKNALNTKLEQNVSYTGKIYIYTELLDSLF